MTVQVFVKSTVFFTPDNLGYINTSYYYSQWFMALGNTGNQLLDQNLQESKRQER